MFSRIFNKNKTEFWKDYNDHFKNKLSQQIDEVRFIVFDTETTGFDINSDRILAIGAISIFKSKMDVGDSLEIYLKQEIFNVDSVEIHGILKEGNTVKHTEKEAIVSFLEYAKNAVFSCPSCCV